VTRRDAAADFFGEEFVPKEAVTMGVATILDAREIALLATASTSRASSSAPSKARSILEIAATFLQRHANDHRSTSTARRERTSRASRRPGSSTKWSGRRAQAASVGVAVAEVRARDPQAHAARLRRAWHVVARGALGSPGALNGEVFNALGAKIRGKSKLPRGKRTICFSPHPDDDVISMGGILRKFVENENDMLVAT
jgi:glucosamine-6-phosphate deaminase